MFQYKQTADLLWPAIIYKYILYLKCVGDVYMTFRFRKSVKLLPGIRLNINKKGVSISAGVKGAHITVNKHGTRHTIGVPGSGLSFTNYQKHGKDDADQQQSPEKVQACADSAATPRNNAVKIIKAVIMVIVSMFLLTTCFGERRKEPPPSQQKGAEVQMSEKNQLKRVDHPTPQKKKSYLKQLLD